MSDTSANIIFAGNDASDDLTILDVLDHVLNAGVVIRGNLIISLAGVDLIYVGLDVILSSVETALRHMRQAQGHAALRSPETAE
jgi:hypothetical protein